MKILNLRKETSERSDGLNWAKNQLIESAPFYFESIEGCNQNANNIVTHLLERARIDLVNGDLDIPSTVNAIIALEGKNSLTRKINFARLFDIPLSYVLYCNESEKVFLFSFRNLEKVDLQSEFDSFKDFADWISQIKGWKSSKSFREIDDLPYFDKQLRRHNTPWPTNLDCFFTNKENEPIGLIEFQNADRVGVLNHCSNDYMMCKQSYTNSYGYINYHDDIRRWTSQEIIRVQSGIRLLIITWSSKDRNYVLKEVESISLPYFPKTEEGNMDWTFINNYKEAMNLYSTTKNEVYKNKIMAKGKTYGFKKGKEISEIYFNPPLSIEDKTFPQLYYTNKIIGRESNDLPEKLTEMFKGN